MLCLADGDEGVPVPQGLVRQAPGGPRRRRPDAREDAGGRPQQVALSAGDYRHEDGGILREGRVHEGLLIQLHVNTDSMERRGTSRRRTRPDRDVWTSQSERQRCRRRALQKRHNGARGGQRRVSVRLLDRRRA
jgi:hypothetical protein